MKPYLYHLQIRVSNFRKSLKFYSELLRYFRWLKLHQGKDYCGWGSGAGDIWLVQTEKKYLKPPFHRKRTGLNHVAFRVGIRKDVDRFYRNFLLRKKVPVLYGGPKEYPEYQKGYYAVFFEDPDRIKLEVVYLP